MLSFLREKREEVIGDASAYGEWLARKFGAIGGSSGVAVTDATALNHQAVWAGLDFISSSIAMLPVNLYQPDPARPGDANAQQVKNTTSRLLSMAPNSRMTPIWFLQTGQATAILRGNHYAWIDRDRNGQPQALWPLPSTTTEPVIFQDNLIYETTVEGMRMRLPSMDVLHLRGFGLAGLKGESFLSAAGPLIGLGLAAQQFGAMFFGQGANPRFIVTHPDEIGGEAQARLSEQLQELYGGLKNSFRAAVLEEGMKVEKLTIAPNEAQFLETRKDNRVEIAGMMRVPPSMIGIFDRATWGNAEQMDTYVVKYTLGPWIKRWEQELNFKLLSQNQKNQGFFFKFNTNALLRGDIRTRAEFYKTMMQGVMTGNEIRDKEDLPWLPGLDEPFVPLNMIEASEAATAGSEQPDDDDEEDDDD